jgi:hypothetical protein
LLLLRIITDIFERLLEDNEPELITPTSPLRSDCLLQLNDLKTSVQCGKTGYLRGIFDSGNDLQIWDQILSSIPEEQRNWLDAPWLITEFYFCKYQPMILFASITIERPTCTM